MGNVSTFMKMYEDVYDDMRRCVKMYKDPRIKVQSSPSPLS